MKSTTISLLTLGLVLAFAPSASKAQPSPNPPGQISYQGFLTDANGFPLATNNPVNFNVQFRIYNASTTPPGTPPLWGESQVVTVDRGYFTVMLGNGSILSGVTNTLAGIFSGSDASDRYLELTVQGLAPVDSPIQPRLRLLASPYSFLASRSLVAESVAPSTAVADANLSQNVALRNASQTFTGVNTFNNEVDISGSNILQFGAGVAGRQYDAGKIGYKVFDDALDIVGAGTSGSNRKIKFWAEGGADFAARVNFEGVASFPGGANFPGGATMNGNLTMGNSQAILAANTSGAIEYCLYPRWSDNVTYLNYGSAGFNIRNNANTTTMFMDNNGLVGIGTTTPTKATLEIDLSSGTHPTYNPAGILKPDGVFASLVGYGTASIWAVGSVLADHFAAFSDERIKNIQGQSDGTADLKTLLGIKVTDYTYKDTITKGNRPHKKVVAQQVELVYPQAVSKSTDVVPDIYRNATLKDGWVQLATDLKVGERVKLIGEKEKGIYAVLEVRDGAFRTDFKPATEQVFVYGREVNDFRSVDYEAISMLNVSATQELARRLQRLEAREAHLAELEQKASQVAALEKQAEAHEAERLALEKRTARVDELEREVSDLKVVVTRLAERKEHQASARNASEQPATPEPSGALVALDNAGGATQLGSTAQPGE